MSANMKPNSAIINNWTDDIGQWSVQNYPVQILVTVGYSILHREFTKFIFVVALLHYHACNKR